MSQCQEKSNLASKLGNWHGRGLSRSCFKLQEGVAQSKFGAMINFQVENIVLRVNIQNLRLGRGVSGSSTFGEGNALLRWECSRHRSGLSAARGIPSRFNDGPWA